MEKSKFGDCRKFVILGPEDNTAFYDDHRALFKFIVQAPISEEDFHHLMKYPGETPLFSYLCFLSMLQNPEIDDFGAWAAYANVPAKLKQKVRELLVDSGCEELVTED